MIVKLLTEHHLEFLSLKGGYRGSSESTHTKMPHCWKLHALAHLLYRANEIEGGGNIIRLRCTVSYLVDSPQIKIFIV